MAYLNTKTRQLVPIKLAQRRFQLEILSAILDNDTSKLMEYRKLIRKPKYLQLYRNSYVKEIGRFAQVMPGPVEGTNTIFLIDKKYIPVESWKDVTYGRVVVDY